MFHLMFDIKGYARFLQISQKEAYVLQSEVLKRTEALSEPPFAWQQFSVDDDDDDGRWFSVDHWAFRYVSCYTKYAHM